MAQRAAGFAKRPASLTAATVERGVRVPAVHLDPVALNLGPLVAPYRKHGRLSLRIERMPQTARLSAGRNNGDNSWSLGLDELDGLMFIPPEGMEQLPPLALRLINVGQGGETIALLDLAIGAQGAMAVRQSADPIATQQLRRLQDELDSVKAQLAEREEELAQRAPSTGSRKNSDAELAAARTAFQAELDGKLAAASALAAEALEAARSKWSVEMNSRLAEIEDREQSRRLEARDLWKREAHAALKEAETTWRMAEEGRLAAAEKKLREEFARTKSGGSDRLDAELSAVRAQLASRESEIAKLKSETASRDTAGADLARARAEMADVVARAKAREGEVAALRSQLNHRDNEEVLRLDRELVKLRGTLLTREEELQRLRGEADKSRADDASRNEQVLADLRGRLTAREAEIAALKQAATRAQGDAAAERARLDNATDDLRRKLAAREADVVTLKESVSRLQSDHVMARASLESEVAELRRRTGARETEFSTLTEAVKRSDGEARRLQGELAELRRGLSAREAEIAGLREAAQRGEGGASESALAAARARWQQEEEERRNAAEATFKAELARLAAEASSASNTQAADVAHMRSELTAAKAALAARDGEIERLRASAAAAAAAPDAQHLKDQLEEVRVTLAAREADLAGAREAFDREKASALLNAEADWKAAEAERVAALEAGWNARQQSTSAPPANDGTNAAELERARADLETLKKTIAESAKAFEQHRAEADAARERARNDAQSALERAEIEWRNGEAGRLQRVEDRVREECLAAGSGEKAQLAEAVRRYQTAEANLAQARLRRDPSPQVLIEPEVAELQLQLSEVQATLAERDNELAYALATLEQKGIRPMEGGQGQKFKTFEERQKEKSRKDSGRLVLQLAVVFGVILAAVVAYPYVVPLLPYEWQVSIANTTANVSALVGQKQAPAATTQAAPPPAAAPVQSATITHSAKLRGAASPKAKALTVLAKGASVSVLKTEGNWTQVRASGGLEGWVFGPYLSDIAQTPDTKK